MKVIFKTIILLMFPMVIHCQNIKSDLSLIGNNTTTQVSKDNNYKNVAKLNDTKPINFKHRSIVSLYNPLSLAAKWAMLFYQNVASPELFRSCLCERSCSNYSKKAIEEFGLIKGVFMSADRLMRCNIIAISDSPPKAVCADGLIMDEPSKYHLKPRK